MSLKVLTYPKDAKLDLDTLSLLNSLYSLFNCVKPVILHRIDQSISDIVARHVSEIFSRGYAEHLDAYDFFHGHFFVNSHCVEKELDVWSPEEGNHKRRIMHLDMPSAIDKNAWLQLFLDSQPHFVYHTREHRPSRKSHSDSPRSIIGNAQGNVYVMKGSDNLFLTHGTVSGFKQFYYDNKMLNGMGIISGKVYLSTEDFPKAIINMFQFYILSDRTGRYQTSYGKQFDIYYELQMV